MAPRLLPTCLLVVLVLLLLLPPSSTLPLSCPDSPLLLFNPNPSGFSLSNGYVCLLLLTQPLRVLQLSSDYAGAASWGRSSLSGDGLTLETEGPDGTIYSSSSTGTSSCSNVSVSHEASDSSITVTVANIIDRCPSPLASETWTFHLSSSSRALSFTATGSSTLPTSSTPLIKGIRRVLQMTASSVYTLFDRGVSQMKGAPEHFTEYASMDALSTLYALGGAGGDESSAGNTSLTLLRNATISSLPFPLPLLIFNTAPHTSPPSEPLSAFHDILALPSPPSQWAFDSWTCIWCNASAAAPPSSTWSSSMLLLPNSYDFPILPDVVGRDVQGGMQLADLHVFMTGVFASAVGNIFSHDNAVVPGERVAQMATTIHRPDVGYSGTYNYFDPDNYISTYALLQTGYSYLHEQVRLVLERSGAFINAKGQLPHHFVGDKPVFQALSGATQTGPNVFWIMSCFNYVKHSGNMTWLQAYMPTLRLASSFLFDLIDPTLGLINAPGSLYIDVFIRGNFTSDSNAMAVIFFREFAAAEAAVGNSSGAATLLQLADRIAVAMNAVLWHEDHYVTQMNPDGSTRDFVDYDSNLIAVAAGVPSAGQAALLLRRIDGGRCTHGRATFVSEVYYGPHDTTNGNVGDSWCAMARNGWFDALARQQVNDADTFAHVLLAPLADDVRRWTWLHERYFCDGTQQPNRTWAYFEYPAVAALMTSVLKYGVQYGLQAFTVNPLASAPANFSYTLGSVLVEYSAQRVVIVPPPIHGTTPTSSMTVHGLPAGAKYSIEQDGCSAGKKVIVTTTNEGVLQWTDAASISDARCRYTCVLQ